MKGSGRFGKYGDLKRKQRIRQNLMTPPVAGNQHLILAGQADKRKKPLVSPNKGEDQEGAGPRTRPKTPEKQ
ncbi:MAG TPA: hypothetical protein DCZ69_17600 [Syntrophobacteraceae bacterium]|nr:hypothetical protein [Syntrophobacteraceae bacterium]HBD10070.1 hypothetical protein [Syntrophobacteraceae bacterium]HBZ56099.1 hypothetical protein [Syntrophobacteraceae bacterium]